MGKTTGAAAVLDATDTARKYDCNGWFEVAKNPLSIAGVFPYLGKRLPNAPDPDAMYNVYRPPEELEDPECVASFRLVPWIDEHSPGMLGDTEDGLTSPTEYGVHGVVGENVFYENGVLYGNIRLWSESLRDQVADGKKELSLGYRALYDWTPGVTPDGQPYDVIQCKIRGNHLASVPDGRMGSEVAVLDAADKPKPEGETMDEENNEMTLDQAVSAFSKLMPVFQKLAASQAGVAAVETGAAEAEATGDDDDIMVGQRLDQGGVEDDEDEEGTGTGDEDEEGTGTGDEDDEEGTGTADEEDPTKKVEGTGMDANDIVRRTMREMAQRDKLAAQLSKHVGVFDHSDMTVRDVQRYGVKKLGLQVAKGQEAGALAGYMAAAGKTAARKLLKGNGMDSADKPTGGAITKFIRNGGNV